MKKGFASAVFVGLVVVALVFLASTLQVRQSGFENAALHSRLVAEKAVDSKDFLNATLNDAILDSACSIGCTNPLPDFCSSSFQQKFASYRTASSVLNDSAVRVYWTFAPSCSSSTVSGSALLDAFSLGGQNFIYKNDTWIVSKTVVIAQTVQGGNVVGFSMRVNGETPDFSLSCPASC
jgi:hypothetical protein